MLLSRAGEVLRRLLADDHASANAARTSADDRDISQHCWSCELKGMPVKGRAAIAERHPQGARPG